MSKMNFGERFFTYRKQKGISQYKIAKCLNVPTSNICNLEKGRRSVGDRFLERIASIEELGITLKQLRAWKLLDEYSREEISIALQEG